MNDQELKESMRLARPFRYLKPYELETIASYCQVTSFTTNDIVVQQGKYATGMYIILNGKAAVSAKILGIGLITLANIAQGELIGEEALIANEPLPVTVVAETPLTCILLSTKYFEILATFFPAIRYKIIKAITERVCNRIEFIYQKLIPSISESEMSTDLGIANIILASYRKPKKIDLEETGIHTDQLRDIPLISDLNEDECAIVLEYLNPIMAYKKSFLIKHTEAYSNWYLVLRGAIKTEVIVADKTVKLAVLGPTCIFGGMQDFASFPNIISYSACERSILLQMDLEQISLLKKNHIRIWYRIYDTICKSIVAVEKDMNKLYLRLQVESYR